MIPEIFPNLRGRALPLAAALVLLPALHALAAEDKGAAPSPAVVGQGDPSRDAAATVVVFNLDDPESGGLAQFYAQKRGIPAEQVVGLHCSQKEEITRAEYDDTIADPLRKIFTEKEWWILRDAEDPLGPVAQIRIRFVALIRGIPLKIAPAPNYEGDKPYHTSPIGEHNEAAVDSELSVLSLRLRAVSGAVNNPYFRSFSSIHDAKQHELLLVARLDGPSATIVRRMIVDSLAAEQSGLRGFAYIDARGLSGEGGLQEGDRWLLDAANHLQRTGVPVILDNGPALFPAGYPMRNAALYFGWYSDEVGGALAGVGIRFRPGAVACHIHSFSASTIRNAQSRWIGPLLTQGAAATMGNVYEPFLTLTPHLDVFVERLTAGFTFAESAYMSQRVLSWMNTFVGDPLYRPFPLFPEVAHGKDTAEWDAYQTSAKLWFSQRPAAEEAMRQAAARLHSGMIYEGLGLLQMRANDGKAAISSFDLARKTYTNVDDSLRATIHEVIQLKATGREDEAVKLVQQEAKAHRTVPAVGVLKLLVGAAGQ